MRKDLNWEDLKTEYVTTNTCYREMCEKYSIPMKTLTYRGKCEKWVQARKQFRESVAKKAVNKLADEKANKLVKIAQSADKMANVIHRAMEDEKQFFRRIDVTSGQEIVSNKLDSKAMRDMTAAMKDLTAVIRNVWNIPTEAETMQLQLARERLEIEKKKAETVEDIATSGGIVFLPERDEEEDE